MTRVYIGLGSNLGDRLEHLRLGLGSLSKRGLRLVRTSAVYESEPVLCPDPHWFLNAVALLETPLPPREVLAACLAVEAERGRSRSYPNAPRTLDLDLLFYGDQVVCSPDLVVPHPRLPERRFVLLPLAEVAGAFQHPHFGLTVEELLARCADTALVNRYCSFPSTCL